ncbi:M23 family metallopeptidase [Cellulomonas fimi]|uniref:M23 family metallopeptidase n=1 Tax=Cellulomonas fimi TaxID=1708 RepID=A0A7Y0LX78_CELFI|nr:M23 family metallopeptidase [Cellulomonas fimi]NMR19584.1 M23 family metallopeptidase [Cellulomonas fimi]
MPTSLTQLAVLGVAVAALATGVAVTPSPTSLPGPPGTPATTGAAVSYVSPVPGGTGTPTVVRPFDGPDERWAAGHRGVDLASGVGDELVSPAPGTVTFAGTVVDRGVLSILHPDGLRTSLEPIVPVVVAGQDVRAGEPVGTLGPERGHCAPAPCLHWGVRRGEEYLDPLTLLAGSAPIVLLPGD